jgi:ribosomal protein L17
MSNSDIEKFKTGLENAKNLKMGILTIIESKKHHKLDNVKFYMERLSEQIERLKKLDDDIVKKYIDEINEASFYLENTESMKKCFKTNTSKNIKKFFKTSDEQGYCFEFDENKKDEVSYKQFEEIIKLLKNTKTEMALPTPEPVKMSKEEENKLMKNNFINKVSSKLESDDLNELKRRLQNSNHTNAPRILREIQTAKITDITSGESKNVPFYGSDTYDTLKDSLKNRSNSNLGAIYEASITAPSLATRRKTISEFRQKLYPYKYFLNKLFKDHPDYNSINGLITTLLTSTPKDMTSSSTYKKMAENMDALFLSYSNLLLKTYQKSRSDIRNQILPTMRAMSPKGNYTLQVFKKSFTSTLLPRGISSIKSYDEFVKKIGKDVKKMKTFSELKTL